jgi:YVTN family beta-propeller protein
VYTTWTDGTVTVTDIDTNTVQATVHVGQKPSGIAVTPDGTRIYVTNKKSSTVSVIDRATNTVTTTVNLGRDPVDLFYR